MQLPNFSMILPAGVIRDDFVFLGHGSCVNQPLGPAGGVKPEASIKGDAASTGMS